MRIPVMFSFSKLALPYDNDKVTEFELPGPEGTPAIIVPVGGPVVDYTTIN